MPKLHGNLLHFLYIECIASLYVQAQTGDVYGGAQSSRYGTDPILTILTDLSSWPWEYDASLKGDKERNKLYTRTLNFRYDFQMTDCVTHDNIKEVYLKAATGGTDGWYVESIDTYTATAKGPKNPLTSDPGFSMWVDANEESKYPYNAKNHRLTKAVAGNCISYVKVSATTGNKYGGNFSPKYGDNHLIVITLVDGTKLQAELEGPANLNEPYELELHFASRFQTTRCVASADIKEIRLKTQPGGTDGWYIASIDTYAKGGVEQYEHLTSDQHFYKWLDADEQYPYDATNHLLTWINNDIPVCGYGVRVCECNANAKVCTFNLEIDEIRTFTSYQKFPIDEGTGMFIRGAHGVIHYFEDNGVTRPIADDKPCSDFTSATCTEPQFVDGKTYRLVTAVNGQVPGPTLIVHDQQTVVIHVHNNLTTEGVSIHWHGMHQIGTPWMDGVGQVSQCQIGPSSSFSYMYTASPSGSFWYHSHSGGQRTDGFFGALIVKERPARLKEVKRELRDKHRINGFEDLPHKHTLTLLDWQHEASLDLFTQIHSSLGFYPDKELGIVPTRKDERYESTRSYEKGEVGPVPYYSGIINGKGRHDDVPYEKTRLSIFTVERGKTYRFRLIGAQSLYAYRFSIDGHKLTVVATDGYWIEPVKQVDYIIIHTGERYDFLLNANENARINNYWIRAETLEINTQNGSPPYPSLGHVAEAILHYKQNDESIDPEIPSTMYKDIKDHSPSIKCTSNTPCIAVNCPFEKFHYSYHIKCINVQSLTLLEPTPHDELPAATTNCEGCTHFINFNFEGDSQTSAVNGRNFLLPSFPPQTQNKQFKANDVICNLQADCNPSTLECSCVHIIDIPYQKTIQLVLTAIGKYHNAHPIHLHGHTFHVVHIGYPEYDSTTGFIPDENGHSRDIKCSDTECTKPGCEKERCTRPSWNRKPSLSIHSKTIRKDTVMLPAGGYVVINFLSNNPGHWFLHCHIEVHQLEGMAMIVNEAFDYQKSAPEGLNRCGDFAIGLDEYQTLYSHA